MTTVNPGKRQAIADRIRDRRASEGTLGKPQPEQADPTDSLAAGFRDVTGVTA